MEPIRQVSGRPSIETSNDPSLPTCDTIDCVLGVDEGRENGPTRADGRDSADDVALEESRMHDVIVPAQPPDFSHKPPVVDRSVNMVTSIP
jgi:hypothetical protein